MHDAIRALLVLLLVAHGCTTTNRHDPSYQRNGVQYGVVQGQFHSRWWNFYERGRSFADGEFWNEAEADLRQAIALRGRDQLWPRTYGLHFLPEYFPHRELGIVLYHQGNFDESIDELETSLSQHVSARASFYLDEARKAVVSTLDADAPTLALEPTAGTVGTPLLRIAGVARSEAYMREVWINGAPILVPVSAHEIAFEEEVHLAPGRNEITVEAEDLAGRRVQSTLQIECDLEGPAVSFNSPITLPGVVSGVAQDPSGIAEIVIGGRPVVFDSGEGGQVTFTVEVPDIAGEAPADFLLADSFGNQTTGVLPVAAVQMSHVPAIPVFASFSADVRELGSGVVGLYAANQLVAVANAALAAPAQGRPDIRFTNLADDRTYFLDEIAVAVDIQAAQPLAEATLNGEPLQILPNRTSQRVTRRVPLHEGANRVEATAKDVEGGVGSALVSVDRQLVTVEQSAGKLNVAVLGNVWTGNSPRLADEATFVADEFFRELHTHQRFNLVDRGLLPDILTEQQLNQALGSREERLALGAIVPAEVLVIGRVRRDSDSVEIIAEAISAETSAFIGRADVAGRAETFDEFRRLAGDLALRLVQEFPRAQGQVALVRDGQEFVTNLSSTVNVRESMKLVVFRYGEEILDPVTKESLGRDTEIVAEGLVRAVDDRKSIAERVVNEEQATEPIQLGDSVVIK